MRLSLQVTLGPMAWWWGWTVGAILSQGKLLSSNAREIEDLAFVFYFVSICNLNKSFAERRRDEM